MNFFSAYLRKTWFAALLCGVLAFAAFSPVLSAGFVWDDGIIQSYQLPLFKSVGDAFSPPPQLTEWSKIYFRPVVVLSYMAEDRITEAFIARGKGREDPARATLPHAVSLLLHSLSTAAVVLLAARLLRKCERGWLGALAAGLLFGLLPIHAETACWISGRSDSLATLFLLTGILATIEARDRARWPLLLLGGTLFLLALLSKEVALAGLLLLPAALLATDEGRTPPNPAKWLCQLSPMVGALTVYAALRTAAGVTLTSGATRQGGELVAALLKAVSFYVGSIFQFWHVLPYPAELPGNGSALLWLSLLLVVVMGAFLAWYRGQRFPVFCLFWFAASLLPSLAVLFNNSASIPVAQRYLYLPSVGVALFVAWLLGRYTAGKWRKVIVLFSGLALTVFFAITVSSASIWKSDITFWSSVVEDPTAARHALPWVNLGAAHLYRAEYAAADGYFMRALNPGVEPPRAHLAMAYTNLGVSRMERAYALKMGGRLPEAEALAVEAQSYMDRAVALRLADWTLYKNSAQCMLLLADIRKSRTGSYDTALLETARQHLQKALMFSPGNPDVLEQLGIYTKYANNRN